MTFKLGLQITLNMSKTTRVYFGGVTIELEELRNEAHDNAIIYKDKTKKWHD